MIHADVAHLLQRAEPGAFDFIFLDSERPEYPVGNGEFLAVKAPS